MSDNINLEEELTPEKFEAMMREQDEKRMNLLKSKSLPSIRDLAGALSQLDRTELEDMAFNLNIADEATVGSMGDDELKTKLASAIPDFAKTWFTTIMVDQMGLFDFVMESNGITTEIFSEDGRLDYLRGIGVLFCGMSNAEGKLAWFMPEEIQAEYKRIKNDTFVRMVEGNDEIVRLSAGLVFYYGMVDYDTLYAKIKEYTETDVDFATFMGIIYNGSEWCLSIVAAKHDLYCSDLMDMENLRAEQNKRQDLDYAEISYERAYDAGEENHIESTPEYRKLAQHMMKEFGMDVMGAADVVRNVGALIQNSYGMNDVMGFLLGSVEMKSEDQVQKVAKLVADYSKTLPMWVLKGHAPSEVKSSGKRSGKIGRNDPCPCGSGKKYKNCCLNKVS